MTIPTILELIKSITLSSNNRTPVGRVCDILSTKLTTNDQGEYILHASESDLAQYSLFNEIRRGELKVGSFGCTEDFVAICVLYTFVDTNHCVFKLI